MTSDGGYKHSVEGLLRTGMDSLRPSTGRIPDCRANDPDCNWMCDAYECMAACCDNDIVGYVMDRFSTIGDARHEGRTKGNHGQASASG